MRTKEEIQNNPKLRNIELSMDGGRADIHIGGWDGSVIWSNGAGWEHCSISPYAKRIIPSWSDMCQLKDVFFNDDESVIQIHPPIIPALKIFNGYHIFACINNQIQAVATLSINFAKLLR